MKIDSSKKTREAVKYSLKVLSKMREYQFQGICKQDKKRSINGNSQSVEISPPTQSSPLPIQLRGPGSG